MSNEIRQLSLRIDDDTLRKFRYVCDYNGRSANKQLLFYIKKAIKNFENENGKIDLEE